MKIIYKIDNQNEFFVRWNEYIQNNLTSFKYLPLFLDYSLLYAKYLISDNSFVIIENNQAVAIAFIPIEKIGEDVSISISGEYVFSPLTINKRIEKIVYKIIETICNTQKIDKVQFAIDPLVLQYRNQFNHLVEYGFIRTDTNDCIINLKLTESELWQNLRKSYKSLINNILKNHDFEIIIMDKLNPNYELHELYRKLHAKCAGRKTRNKNTFDKQFEMLNDGYATLIGLKYKHNFIGFNYFMHYKQTAIYASGADDPDYENDKIPIYHVMLWSAIKYYKQNCFEFIEFSQPCSFNKLNGFNDYLDDKQINISHFKRGMGTEMIMAFRGIKYINKQLLRNDIHEFSNIMLDKY